MSRLDLTGTVSPAALTPVEAITRDFLESRGVVAEPQVKLTRNADAMLDAALTLAEGQPDADLWIPYPSISQELLDAGLVARTIHQDGRITYRLTDAGKRWRAA